MKPAQPLDRLFRAAARAPRESMPEASAALEAGVLAALRRARAGEADPWGAFLPLFRAGLAVAACVALLALAVGLRSATPPETDETAFLAIPTLELSYVP